MLLLSAWARPSVARGGFIPNLLQPITEFDHGFAGPHIGRVARAPAGGSARRAASRAEQGAAESAAGARLRFSDGLPARGAALIRRFYSLRTIRRPWSVRAQNELHQPIPGLLKLGRHEIGRLRG